MLHNDRLAGERSVVCQLVVLFCPQYNYAVLNILRPSSTPVHVSHLTVHRPS